MFRWLSSRVVSQFMLLELLCFVCLCFVWEYDVFFYALFLLLLVSNFVPMGQGIQDGCDLGMKIKSWPALPRSGGDGGVALHLLVQSTTPLTKPLHHGEHLCQYHQTSMWHKTELNPYGLHMMPIYFSNLQQIPVPLPVPTFIWRAPDIAANQVKGVCDTNKERFNAQVVPRPNIWMVAKDPEPQRYLPHTLKGAHSLAGVWCGVPVLQSGW